MSKGAETKEKLVALRMTPDDLAQIDDATRRFKGGILEPSRSQMMRLLLRLGLARIKTATAEELSRLVVGGAAPAAPEAAAADAKGPAWMPPAFRK